MVTLRSASLERPDAVLERQHAVLHRKQSSLPTDCRLVGERTQLTGSRLSRISANQSAFGNLIATRAGGDNIVVPGVNAWGQIKMDIDVFRGERGANRVQRSLPGKVRMQNVVIRISERQIIGFDEEILFEWIG